jgi:hypothetical protein
MLILLNTLQNVINVHVYHVTLCQDSNICLQWFIHYYEKMISVCTYHDCRDAAFRKVLRSESSMIIQI